MSCVTSPALHVKPSLIRVPLFAQIAAGNPFQDCFQIGSAIVNGDVAICRFTTQLERNGQLAAVLIGDGLTLKYVHVETSGGCWLRAANPRFPDRFFLPGEAMIQAVALTIERDL